MSCGNFEAAKIFWETPELLETLLPFLDLKSTLQLAKTHELTQDILQGASAWNKLIRRCCLRKFWQNRAFPLEMTLSDYDSEEDADHTLSESESSRDELEYNSDASVSEDDVEEEMHKMDEMDVVRHLVAMLKLMKNPKANMLDLLDAICKRCPPDVVSSNRGLGAVTIGCPNHPDSHEVLLSDFMLLEAVEGAFGTSEQKLAVISLGGTTLDEPCLSALSARLDRQQKKLTSLSFAFLEVRSKESAEAFKTLMEASSGSDIPPSGGIDVVLKTIGGEGWKVLADGVRLNPSLILDGFSVLKDDLDETKEEDIRVMWDALKTGGKVFVELHPEELGYSALRSVAPLQYFEKAEGEAGWTKLVQIMEMSKEEWAAKRYKKSSFRCFDMKPGW